MCSAICKLNMYSILNFIKKAKNSAFQIFTPVRDAFQSYILTFDINYN